MTEDDLSLAIRKKLHPDPYDREFVPCGEFDFLIARSSALPGGRYAFAFRRIGTTRVAEVYRQARAEARKLLKARWFFHEVGLYLMLCGPEATWRERTIQGRVDRTSFHHILVQAVHFVDPETGADHLNQSAWGPVKFGGLIPIPKLVGEVISEIS